MYLLVYAISEKFYPKFNIYCVKGRTRSYKTVTQSEIVFPKSNPSIVLHVAQP